MIIVSNYTVTSVCVARLHSPSLCVLIAKDRNPNDLSVLTGSANVHIMDTNTLLKDKKGIGTKGS